MTPSRVATRVATSPGLHRHAWKGAQSYLREERPWSRMRCACGAERSIRAWERYWDPAADTVRG